MATEKRTSEQGTVFDAAVLREFVLAALEHDAVTDPVHDLIFEHVVEQKYHPTVVATSLERIITEALGSVTFPDWEWAANTLIEQACDALKIEYHLKRAPEAQPPQGVTAESKRVLRSLDPGKLREQLADVYAHDQTALRALRAWWIIRRISQLTGITREQIRTEARSDAEAIKATREDDTADTDRSSRKANTNRPPDPENKVEAQAASEEANSSTAKPGDRCVGELYRDADGHEVWRIKEVQTGNVLRDGIASDHEYQWLLDALNHGDDYADAQEGLRNTAEITRADHERVIQTARHLDPERFDIDTRHSHPGKYQGGGDLRLAVALDIINGHGVDDERTGDGTVRGYAWRVNRFVGIEDSQGFIKAEEWPTAGQATERLRDFDLPAEDEESTDQSSNTPEVTTTTVPPCDSDHPTVEERLYAQLELTLERMGYDEARGDWWRITYTSDDSWGVKGVIDGEDTSFDVTPRDLGPKD